MMQKVIQLLQLAQNRENLNGILKSKVFSLSAIQNLSSIKRHDPSIRTIIDVGANKGQFAAAAKYFYPDSTIYCFEPSKKNYLKLQNCFKDDKKITIFNCGLGSQNGELEFFEHTFDQINSFLKVTDDNKNPNYKDSISSVSNVQVKKLDDIKGLEFVHPVLLKLDVQGYEEEVLNGALKSLKHVDYIVIELPFEKLYENQKLFNDMNLIMIELGFYLLAPLGFNSGLEGKIIEIDAFYKNKNDSKNE